MPGDTTRPITDKVREALFNILGVDIQGATVLDLFAGTGSVGIEALSRGADDVYFVELNRKAIAIIQENLRSTGLSDGAFVRHADAFSMLEGKVSHHFDYIYVAPPQYKEMWRKALLSLDKHIEWLSEDAWVIVQIHPTEYKPIGEGLPINNLIEFDRRQYGSTLLVFYRKITIENAKEN